MVHWVGLVLWTKEGEQKPVLVHLLTRPLAGLVDANQPAGWQEGGKKPEATIIG